jgi:hypothetical protein
MNRWKRKVQALARLAEDQHGKPEGELAREKMRQILERYPEARDYGPARQFMMSDIAWMFRHNISTDGSWTGHDVQEAVALMETNYRRRIEEFKRRGRLGEMKRLAA